MSENTASVQRSFRLSPTTSALLDQMAEQSNESRNALADRLLGEGVRTEMHPLIRFRTGAAGRREPLLVGTRLLVRQVVETLKAADGNVDQVAEYLDLPSRSVRAALSYYADFADEVDADAEWAQRVESEAHARWEREQAALG